MKTIFKKSKEATMEKSVNEIYSDLVKRSKMKSFALKAMATSDLLLAGTCAAIVAKTILTDENSSQLEKVTAAAATGAFAILAINSATEAIDRANLYKRDADIYRKLSNDYNECVAVSKLTEAENEADFDSATPFDILSEDEESKDIVDEEPAEVEENKGV